MSLDSARAKAGELLKRPSTNQGNGLEAMGAAPGKRRFSAFVRSDLKKAVALTERWMKVAEQRGTAGLDDILADADAEMSNEDTQLVKHALMMFITHDPIGRQLPLPPLRERDPEVVVPSKRAAAVPPAQLEAMGGLGQEAALDYFREDTGFNDHHGKWHVVYPTSGINGQLRNRQGELFWYMHAQMLARYDAERASLGLPVVVPYADFTKPIVEGYDAEIPGYADRPEDAVIPVFPIGPGVVYGPKEHNERGKRLITAAETGKFAGGENVTIGRLADTTEANIGSIDAPNVGLVGHYGDYHNVGHGMIAASGDPGSGVMGDTRTAVRDPIFYRWHRAIDDVIDVWLRTLAPHDLDKSDAKVLAKEVAVIPASAIPAGQNPQAWAAANFGGANWGTAPGGVTLNQLATKMGSEQVGQPPVPKPHLDHDDFYWLFRVENPTANDVDVTLRVFLTPEDIATTDRRRWIEMDKFTAKVPAGAKLVLLRSGKEAAVVRKPALRPGDPPPPPHPGADPTYCDCGWPYHLLLPRGSAAGKAFRALVLLTDWTLDQVPSDKPKCGSLSFCGARDADYPDQQEMGFPFNRPIDLPALMKRANVATRTVTIRHT